MTQRLLAELYTLLQYLAILLYSSESTEHSIAICTWLRLYDGSSAQGAYNFQVKRPFTSLKMVLVSLINYMMICLLLISLRVQKLLGLRGGRHKFNYGSGQRA